MCPSSGSEAPTASKWTKSGGGDVILDFSPEDGDVEPPPIPSNEANLTPWTKSNFLSVDKSFYENHLLLSHPQMWWHNNFKVTEGNC